MSNILFNFEPAGLSDTTISEKITSLDQYRMHMSQVVESSDYDQLEASLVAPSDQKILSSVTNMITETCSKNLKYIFVVGIGGSNLGTKAIYDALVGLNDSYRHRVPNIIFVDTVGEKLFEILQDVCKESIHKTDEFLINVISKSGGTAETIFNLEVLYDMFSKKFGSTTLERIVVTTNENSALWNKAEELGIHKLSIPEKVGGRYSVFTAVGLFPLGAAGFDMGALLNGAQDMRTDCLSETNNNAMISAITTSELYQNNFAVHNTFIFKPELESMGRWYRQLMGESIGKEYDLDGKEVRTGMIPMVSVGSTDLHSMTQLYLGGPKTIFHNFVYAHADTETAIPSKRLMEGLVSDINELSNNKLMHAIMQGTQVACKKQQIPFIDITLKDISEYTLGEYLQFRMMEMMYLARLLNVNAFDQPSVENYKIETKEILASK